MPAGRILPGTGCASPADALTLGRHAVAAGCRTLLVMPPFFFKNVPDGGVFRFYADLIEGIGDPAVRIVIYNFPAVTGVAVGTGVVGRLIETFGPMLAGVKDSSGDWAYVTALIEGFPGLAVFSGWETLLPRLLRAGGSGNISGMANVIPGLMRRLFDACPAAADDPLLARVTEMVGAVSAHSVTPALKAVAANLRHEPSWRNMRPPLMPLERDAEAGLLKVFAAE